MKNAKLFFLLLMTSGLVFLSCKEKTKSEIAKEKIEAAADAVGDLFKEESGGLEKEINKAREAIEDKIADLKAKLADTEDKGKIEKGIDRLEKQRDKLDASLDRLGKNAKEDWANFKSGVRKTIKDIQ